MNYQETIENIIDRIKNNSVTIKFYQLEDGEPYLPRACYLCGKTILENHFVILKDNEGFTYNMDSNCYSQLKHGEF